MGYTTRTVVFGTLIVVALVVVGMILAGFRPAGREMTNWLLLWGVCWLAVFGLLHTGRTYNSNLLLIGALAGSIVSLVPFVLVMLAILK